MEALKKQKRTIKGYITRNRQAMEALIQSGPLDIERLSALEATLESYRRYESRFSDLVENILMSADDTNDAAYSDLESKLLDEVSEANAIANKFDGIIKAFHRKITGTQSRDSLVGDQQTDLNASFRNSSSSNMPKLEKIQVPKFDGEILNFPSFKGMYDNLVHNNSSLSSVQKLHYLKQSLMDGSAHCLIRDFPLTETSYPEAYACVCARFDNKRAIVRALFSKLYNLESISTSSKIRSLIDNVDSTIRGLKAVGEKIDETFSRYIAFVVTTRLDKKTSEDWEHSVTSTKTFPLYQDLQKFLVARLFSIEEKVSDKFSKPASSKQAQWKSSFNSSYVNTSKESDKITDKCSLCHKEKHPVFRCDKFRAKTPRERFEHAKKHRLCIVCLAPNHSCNSCPNRSEKVKCSCGQPHNYLLHFDPVDQEKRKEEKESYSSSSSSAKSNVTDWKSPSDKKVVETSKLAFSCASSRSKDEVVLLPSALVRFECGSISGVARVLLDSCSQATLISDVFVRKFKLPTYESNTRIKGISASSVGSSSAVNLSILSRNKVFITELEADVVPAACLSYTAAVSFPPEILNRLENLNLAEPCLAKPGQKIDSVDIIIGSKYYEKCILDGVLRIDSLNLRRSKFGWVATGVAPIREKPDDQFCGLTLSEINENLVKFWQIEDVESSSSPLTGEEQRCVEHFENNYAIAEDCKFMVKLPLKIDRSELAPTRKQAERALLRIEGKLLPELKSVYSQFMKEYSALGHMSETGSSSSGNYFLPHHEVLRESSSTTPLRVVFNASAKTAGKPSLNQALMTGPVIQRDIFDILISFRRYKFAYSADIEKMYRMIWVDPEDRCLQRILWRDSPADSIKEYVLNTVTYGTAPASFIAQKCLRVIAESVEKKQPLVAKFIKNNFYMDDVNVGAETEQELIQLRESIQSVLAERGFNLRKYSSNSRELVRSVPACLHNIDQSEVSILGLSWFPREDILGVRFKSEDYHVSGNVSRRKAVSIISKTFDPLGVFSPVLIRGKLLLQEFWREGKNWDTPSSDELSRKFCEYVGDLKRLTTVKIPRQISDGKLDSIFAFCDASEKAYSAVLYARCFVGGEFHCRFICSKTRVSPLKVLTVPKLELQAAKLLSELVKRVVTSLEIDVSKVYAFSDSTVVLCWLSKDAENWKTFVRNRVGKITSVIPFQNWCYVKTSENPADLATRGLAPEDLCQKSIWYSGPEFIKFQNADSFYPVPDLGTQECLERRRSTVVEKFSFACVRNFDLLEKFSSYTRLIRVMAYVLRFAKCCKIKAKEKVVGLSKAECDVARKTVVRLSQNQSFAAEISLLENGEVLKKKSALRCLDPFLDKDHLLRVGGRLKSASLPLAKRHPLIVSSKSSFTRLYIRFVHEKYFHAGKSFILSFLTSEFWIFGGRASLVKRVIRECITCRRVKGQCAAQIMGQLPSYRVKISRPFSYVGVDYAGYFDCKCVAHRTTRYYKVYAAVFVCLTTRAVQIELVADLTTDGLIEAIQRLISRRGSPVHMFSDNGLNMVGAKNLLSLDRGKLEAFSSKEFFKWAFIPPRSPNFGGIWEAAVRSAKWHLQVVAKDRALSLMEYINLFTRIEAMLNSRPLCYRADAEQGTEVITPAHFLIGDSLLAMPQVDFEENVSLSRRLQLLRCQINGFWKIWSKDYLSQLQQRVRWQARKPNLVAGQVVLVKSEVTKPFHWPLGLIERVYPDADGDVRVVDVRFKNTVKKRSVSSLIPLFENEK